MSAEMLTFSAAPPPPRILSVGTESFEFDGHRFAAPWGHEAAAVYAALIATLPLVYHARRGDGVARSLLVAMRVTVADINGRSYWPPEDQPHAVGPKGSP